MVSKTGTTFYLSAFAAVIAVTVSLAIYIEARTAVRFSQESTMEAIMAAERSAGE